MAATTGTGGPEACLSCCASAGQAHPRLRRCQPGRQAPQSSYRLPASQASCWSQCMAPATCKNARRWAAPSACGCPAQPVPAACCHAWLPRRSHSRTLRRPRLVPCLCCVVGRHGPVRGAVIQRASWGGTLLLHAHRYEGMRVGRVPRWLQGAAPATFHNPWTESCMRHETELAQHPRNPNQQECDSLLHNPPSACRAAPTPPGRTGRCALQGGSHRAPACCASARQAAAQRVPVRWQAGLTMGPSSSPTSEEITFKGISLKLD